MSRLVPLSVPRLPARRRASPARHGGRPPRGPAGTTRGPGPPPSVPAPGPGPALAPGPPLPEKAVCGGVPAGAWALRTVRHDTGADPAMRLRDLVVTVLDVEALARLLGDPTRHRVAF